jgi:hypothetical protein
LCSTTGDLPTFLRLRSLPGHLCWCDSFELVDASAKAEHGTCAPLIAPGSRDAARIESVGDGLQRCRAARSNLYNDRRKFCCLRVGLLYAHLGPAAPSRPRSFNGHRPPHGPKGFRRRSVGAKSVQPSRRLESRNRSGIGRSRSIANGADDLSPKAPPPFQRLRRMRRRRTYRFFSVTSGLCGGVLWQPSDLTCWRVPRAGGPRAGRTSLETFPVHTQ